MKNSKKLSIALGLLCYLFLIFSLVMIGVSYLSMEDAKSRLKFYQSSLGTTSVQWSELEQSRAKADQLIEQKVSFEDESYVAQVAALIEKGLSSNATTYIKIKYLEDYLVLDKVYTESQAYSAAWQAHQRFMTLLIAENKDIWLGDLEEYANQVSQYQDQMWKARLIDFISPWFLHGQERSYTSIEAMNESFTEIIDTAKRVVRQAQDKAQSSKPIRSTFA